MKKNTRIILVLLMIVLLSGCHNTESESKSMLNSSTSSEGPSAIISTAAPTSVPTVNPTSESTEEPSASTPTEDPTEQGSSPEYSYMEGVYYGKTWRELTSEEKTHAPITFEEALDQVIGLFTELQKQYEDNNYFQNHILRHVFYDTEDEVWVFTFGEWPPIPGGGHVYAVSRVGGHLLGEWGTE